MIVVLLSAFLCDNVLNSLFEKILSVVINNLRLRCVCMWVCVLPACVFVCVFIPICLCACLKFL